MTPQRFISNELGAILPPGGRTWIQGCSGESRLLAEAVMIAGDALGAMTFTGIFVGGLTRQPYFANAACTVATFFMTPELRQQHDRVLLLPSCYAAILGHLRRTNFYAAHFSLATPPPN